MLSQLLPLLALAAAARAVSFTVASSGGNATSPYQYGAMFEDINNSGDGGIYAELIQNRAFQGDTIFPKNLKYWNALDGAQLSLDDTTAPLSSALPTSLKVTAGRSSTVGFSNVGFWGFPAVAGWTYKGSFWVHGNLNGDLTVSLVSLTNKLYAQAVIKVSSTTRGWTQYKYTFSPTVSAPNSNNTLNFTYSASAANGPISFNLLSLFPPTYNNRDNGLRVDLMQAMAGLKPSFFRAPGGNNLEGLQAPYWWNWTNTIGPLENRPGFPGTWLYENTNGLGLIEYMLWAKDLGMQPVLAVWAGYYLNKVSIPQADLQVYVNSALNELEFLMGDASTTWGAKRQALGYGPFQINFVEVGNEDGLGGAGRASYSGYRFKAFYDAILAKYPHMTIIASYYPVAGKAPPYSASGDYHEYAVPYQMEHQFNLFDSYTSAHPVLIGEYAVTEYNQPELLQSGPLYRPGAKRSVYPFWYGSVAEAIFLLGAERNSDKMIGTAYAPAFQNYNQWEWIPDLIQFDAYPGNIVLGTSYYVIQLFSDYRITENLPVTITSGGFNPAYFVAGRSAVTGSHIVKLATYNSTGNTAINFSFVGVGAGASATLTWLNAPFNSSNTIGHNVVQTTVSTIHASNTGTFSFELPTYSVAVVEIGATQAGAGYDYSTPTKRVGWKGFKSFGPGY